MITHWRVIPQKTPEILRHCDRCGKVRFRSSGLFRVNAQQRRLDVWLVWRCGVCGRSWNMEVLSRVRPREIPRAEYEGYLENDPNLAFRKAFESGMHRRSKTVPLLAEVPFRVEGEVPLLSPGGQATISLDCGVDFPIRLLDVLREKLGISGARLRKWIARGILSLPQDPEKPEKSKLAPGKTFLLMGMICDEPSGKEHSFENV